MRSPEKFAPKIEKSPIPIEEEPEERLRYFLEIIAEGLKKEGVPVEEGCRIDMDFFKGLYGEAEVENDKKKIEEYQEKFREEREMRAWGKDPEKIIEEEKIGEKLEFLKTGIFSKFLGPEFIVARTSLYDDIKNNIDNVILEKKTENLICAFDEVSDTSGKIYEEKKKEVLKRDRIEGGGKLKYGLKLEKGKLSPERVFNIPIFYLALPKRHIEEGIKNFTPSFKSKSDFEKNLFAYFSTSLISQINSLKLEGHLNQQLKDKIYQFEKTLQGIKN